jgi:hypothetical protein
MIQRLTIHEAENLLEKYYEGLTSVTEEKMLQDFLTQKNLPSRFDADKSILGYFAAQKKNRKGTVIPFIRWASVAAAVLVASFTLNTLMAGNGDNYAYINGKRVTDIETLNASALASIQELSSTSDEVQESAELLTDDAELMTRQLSLFFNMD